MALEIIHNKEGCGRLLTPTKSVLLFSDKKNAGYIYKYQRVIESFCADCKMHAMHWIGVDYAGQERKVFQINEVNHDAWVDRYDRDAVRKGGKCHTVQGSETKYPFRFLNSIPVY